MLTNKIVAKCSDKHKFKVSYHPTVGGHHSFYNRGFVERFVSWDQLITTVCQTPWSSCVWRGGVRLKENFLQASLCVLDFDDGIMTLENAVNNYFCDTTHIIGTTKHHGIEKNGKAACDRFRVVIPFNKVIKSEPHYKYNMTYYIDQYDCDTACKDGGRYFAPCTDIVSVNDDFDDWAAPVKKFDPELYAGSSNPVDGIDLEYSRNYVNFLLREGISENRNNTCLNLARSACFIGINMESLINKIYENNVITRHGANDDWNDDELRRVIRNGYKQARERAE